jgi:hypothetical protein
LQQNGWSIDLSLIHRKWFRLHKKVGKSTQVNVFSRLRNLREEEKAEEMQQEDEKDGVDKDDIMTRLAEHLDEEKYIKMLSSMLVTIHKQGQPEAVAFECKSLEKDILIDYVTPIPGEDASDAMKVGRSCLVYRGSEAFILDDNYRIALHEYLAMHGVDTNLAAAVEQLVIGLHPKSREALVQRLAEFMTQKPE